MPNLLLLPALLLPAAAIADPGAHFHPHGGETSLWLALAGISALVVAAIALRRRG